MANNYQSSLNRYRRYVEAVRARPLWRATLYLALSLVLLIVLLLTALRPTLVTIAKLISDTQKEKELNMKLDEKIHQIQLAQEAIADRRVSPRLTLLDGGLPVGAKYGAMADTILTMASQSGLAVDGIDVNQIQIKPQTVLAASDEASMGTVGWAVRVKGNYANIRRMVQRLENWRRVVDIKKVTITKPADGDVLQANIAGLAGYIYEEK